MRDRRHTRWGLPGAHVTELCMLHQIATAHASICVCLMDKGARCSACRQHCSFAAYVQACMVVGYDILGYGIVWHQHSFQPTYVHARWLTYSTCMHPMYAHVRARFQPPCH